MLVTFLAATAKPRYDLHRKTMWDGKVGTSDLGCCFSSRGDMNVGGVGVGDMNVGGVGDDYYSEEDNSKDSDRFSTSIRPGIN